MSFVQKFNSQVRASQHNTVDKRIKDIINKVSSTQHECSLLALGKCSECNAYLAMRYGNVTVITEKNLEFDYSKEFESSQLVAATVTTSLAVSAPTTPNSDSVLDISVSDLHSKTKIKLSLPVTKEGFVRSLSPHTCEPCSRDHSPAFCEKAHLDEHECKPCNLKHLSDHECKPCRAKHLDDHECAPCTKEHLTSHVCKACTEPHLSAHKCSPCKRKHLDQHTCPSMPCDREHLEDHQCPPCTEDHIPTDAQAYLESQPKRFRTDEGSFSLHTLSSQAATIPSITASLTTIRPAPETTTGTTQDDTPSDEEDDQLLESFDVPEEVPTSPTVASSRFKTMTLSSTATPSELQQAVSEEERRRTKHRKHHSSKSHRSRAPSPTPTVASMASKLSSSRPKPSALASFFAGSPPAKRTSHPTKRDKDDENKH